MAPVGLLFRRRRKTTTLIHHGQVKTKPRDLQARVLSPTRRHNPQPLGLAYQSPLQSNAQVWSTFQNPTPRSLLVSFIIYPDLL